MSIIPVYSWLIQFHILDLKASLNAHVYGQHLVVQTVPAAINGHLTHQPKKALVMSFQGTTGTGKNLVAKVVAENMYKEGMASNYVHVLSATKHFSRHENLTDYQASEILIRPLQCFNAYSHRLYGQCIYICTQNSVGGKLVR